MCWVDKDRLGGGQRAACVALEPVGGPHPHRFTSAGLRPQPAPRTPLARNLARHAIQVPSRTSPDADGCELGFWTTVASQDVGVVTVP
jgi:hypothetical protein